MDATDEKINTSLHPESKHKRSKTFICTQVKNLIDASQFQDKIKKSFENAKTYFEFNNHNFIIGKPPHGPKYHNNDIIPHYVIGMNTASIYGNQTVTSQKQVLKYTYKIISKYLPCILAIFCI